MKTLNELAVEAFQNAKEHGFWDEDRSIPESLCLIHSEVSEALEAYRDGVMDTVVAPGGKPEGFASELADVVIRVLDLAERLDIDMNWEVERKMEFNKSRPYKHGRKVI